ncbi:hypothetical protein DOTSEDRAFT_103928, partial [Dothistroma septosporum NZE10]
IRLVLPPYTIHFKSSTYMNPTTLDFLDKKVCKEILKKCAQDVSVREAIGTDIKFWPELCVLLKAAIPSLERRSFTIWDPSSVDYESTSGALIASHYPGLWKDLERINDLMGIARNVLTTGAKVQDLAASYSLDAEVFRLINCCVRVTARGYDGDAGTGDEEKWQWVVNAYKKLLITSLQFLNNLVAQNERRKLMLWASLFDNSDGKRYVDPTGAEPLWDDTPFADYPLPPEAIEGRDKLKGNGYAFYCKRAAGICKEDYNIERKRDPSLAEMHLEMPRRWAELTDDDHEYWQGLYEDATAKYRQDLAVYEAKMLAATEQQPVLRSDVPVSQQTRQVERKIAMLEEQLAEKYRNESADIKPLEPTIYGKDGYLTFDNQSLQSRPVVADDMRMLFTAEAGTKILESGKAELMKRLEGYEASPESEMPQRPTTEEARFRDMMAAETRDDDGKEEEEEDYPGSTEDGRGLLTDVPLILGPSEIEVLPMLIMSGIVPPPAATLARKCLTKDETNALLNMHVVRTHLLLSQSSGRNLLRELLIFVAAWDLREEELYFKFMVKIMEAILRNGLMPYAYHAFRDRSRSKDIISPAQAVIMKLLTCIFRARGEAQKAAVAANAQHKNGATAVDLHILNFIFTEFRQHIIPQTCALVFLQGQIHAGRASPEDFPLNLWDMERMYEGVYQYLEFFAVLTEEGVWKGILGEWEMASELVTLLRELEGGIPKMGAVVQSLPRRVENVQMATPSPLPPMSPMPVPSAPVSTPVRMPTPVLQQGAPVAIERPFDPLLEAETPLAYADEHPSNNPPLPNANVAPHHDQDEPSDFEWRNLKKLTVLVLSSLIWKNRTVQDQVRRYGGLEALVGCCRPDEHNPYIREHAIMCLRFAVEGCEENGRVIRSMAEGHPGRKKAPVAIEGGSITLSSVGAVIEDVPREVLDTQGYETFMDPKGQVGLRRK